MQRTGAQEVETTAVYWRGFPVLQLAMVAPPDADPAAPLQLLGMLYTPEQTFSSLLVVPRGDERAVGRRVSRRSWTGSSSCRSSARAGSAPVTSRCGRSA